MVSLRRTPMSSAQKKEKVSSCCANRQSFEHLRPVLDCSLNLSISRAEVTTRKKRNLQIKQRPRIRSSNHLISIEESLCFSTCTWTTPPPFPGTLQTSPIVSPAAARKNCPSPTITTSDFLNRSHLHKPHGISSLQNNPSLQHTVMLLTLPSQ